MEKYTLKSNSQPWVSQPWASQPWACSIVLPTELQRLPRLSKFWRFMAASCEIVCFHTPLFVLNIFVPWLQSSCLSHYIVCLSPWLLDFSYCFLLRVRSQTFIGTLAFLVAAATLYCIYITTKYMRITFTAENNRREKILQQSIHVWCRKFRHGYKSTMHHTWIEACSENWIAC
jgi:hypothetical protein